MLAVALLIAAAALHHHPASANPPIYVHPEERAAGNDRPEAVRIARALLTQMWPATIALVRVDAVGGHRVAGIVLSGVKFHRPLDRDGFLDEVTVLVARAFAASPVEEVDVWATVPIPVAKGAIVSGDLAVPTSRTVFACSIRRDRLADLRNELNGADVYWDTEFMARLRGSGKGSNVS